MYRKLNYLVCFILVTFLAGVVQAVPLAPDDSSVKDNLSLWLRNPGVNFDPTTNVWMDVSGNAHDAEPVGEVSARGTTFVGPTLSSGSNPAIFGGEFTTVKFAGDVDDLLRATNLNAGEGMSELTIFAVYSISNIDQAGADATRPVGIGSYQGEGANLGNNFNLSIDVTIRKDNGFVSGATVEHPEDQFFIRIARMNSSGIDQWFNTDGILEQVHSGGGPVFTTSTDTFYLGDLRGGVTDNYYSYTDIEIAEVVVHNTALADVQIEGINEWLQAQVGEGGGPPLAAKPNPANGALHENTWVNVSWRPGFYAVSHDVYIGDNFDDVNDGAESTFVGNQTGTFIVVGFPGFAFPDGLIPGTTYYWRIDEVNDAEPNSPWKGDIWSFSIPPKTAYFPDPTDGAESVAVDVELNWTEGFGSKLHTVYFGDNFDDVSNAAGGLPQGSATYTPSPLQMAQTYYWRVDEFDAVDTFKGDVWSFTTEGAVKALEPANGAIDVIQTPVLTWIPNVFAASHEVYFGSDAESVKNADASSPEYKRTMNLGSESYDAGQLEWNTTYYWRIDEANNANADSLWKGNVWSFTTANFLIIDDFESYNDINEGEPGSNRIYLAWVDGYDDPAVNGSVVGNDPPPIAEQTIVHSGNQSMPMTYDNAVGKSEATLTLTSNRDWTINGVNTLTIWFRGESSNAAEQMYVALNGSARVDHDDPNAATKTAWTHWNVDLQAFADQGVNLANINSITLGLSSVTGGTGKMYFDDIRLYPPIE